MKEKVSKRDHYVIWFNSVSEAFASILSDLEPEQPIKLLINNVRTVWKRMKPGNAPTRGIKISEGRDFWEKINLNDQFDLELDVEQDLGHLQIKQARSVQIKQTALKNDDVIWFNHISRAIAKILYQLEPEQPVNLLINGFPTVWKRMRPANGRPVPGIKIDSGSVMRF